MNVKKLIGINNKIANVFQTPPPYWWALQGEDVVSEKTAAGDMVLFLGNDMATFTKMGMDADLYIKLCNKCLDYIRRELGNYRLSYKRIGNFIGS